MIVRRLYIHVTDGIDDGNPKDIRFFEFKGIPRIVFEQQGGKEGETGDRCPFRSADHIGIQEGVEREYLHLLLRSVHEENPSSLQRESHIVQPEFILFQACLYIADKEPGSESDDIRPVFPLEEERFFLS